MSQQVVARLNSSFTLIKGVLFHGMGATWNSKICLN